MEKLTFEELEKRKQYLADRKDFFQMQNDIRQCSMLIQIILDLISCYFSESAIRKGHVVCTNMYSFKKHYYFSDIDSMRTSDLPFLMLEEYLRRIEERLSHLSKINYHEYIRHKKMIDKLLYGVNCELTTDLRKVSFDNPLYGVLYSIDTERLEELAKTTSEAELLEKSANEIINGDSQYANQEEPVYIPVGD